MITFFEDFNTKFSLISSKNQLAGIRLTFAFAAGSPDLNVSDHILNNEVSEKRVHATRLGTYSLKFDSSRPTSLSSRTPYTRLPPAALTSQPRSSKISTLKPSAVFNQPDTKLKMSQLKHIKSFCSGSKSKLYRARLNDMEVIVKKLDMSKYDQLIQQEFDIEIALLSNLSHTSIVQSHGNGTAVTVDEVTKRSTEVPFIILELLSGHTIAHHLSLKKPTVRPFTELRYLRMIKELAAAISYLHYHAHKDYIIIHRDLKPDNIGFTLQGTLKLLDFGLSTCIPRHSEANGDNDESVYAMSGSTGSLRYMAPEVALNQPYNEKVDIYSFGMIAYEIISGFTPFKGYSRELFTQLVIHGNYRPSLSHDANYREIKMHENIRELIKLSWDVDYRKRPTSKMLYSIITQTEMIQTALHQKRNFFRRMFDDFCYSRNSI